MSRDEGSIEMLTMTRLWLFGRSLHAVGKFRMPFPLSYRVIGYSLGVGVPWWTVLAWLHVGFAHGGTTLHVVVPGAVVYWLLKKVDEGARASELVGTWTRFAWHSLRGLRVRPVVLRGRVARPALVPVRVKER